MAGALAGALGARALVLTHFGRRALDRERASAMWALGLPEAQREVLCVCEGLIEREAAPEGKEADADCDTERVREGVPEVQGEPEKEPAKRLLSRGLLRRWVCESNEWL
jgi:hypothetical protein